ncbi:hypothetical protein HYFRA_00005891 [Hymenoscyphus fraxineus]|uniref:Uncharacterized protein n=1 Tax=Hymenoscyphus fraxineus TaxID=746836 RepID=A0A9N9KWA5_9HELO|nr:hypothetical protein HYFRA_00005891 [Hymenoscyphus fraxineus]
MRPATNSVRRTRMWKTELSTAIVFMALMITRDDLNDLLVHKTALSLQLKYEASISTVEAAAIKNDTSGIRRIQ